MKKNKINTNKNTLKTNTKNQFNFEICKNENSLLVVNNEIENKKRYVGIYIHIPFCNSKCFYCNFNSYVIDTKNKNQIHKKYIEALKQEITSYKNILSNKIVNTIFIGGGTPNVLIGGGIEDILNHVKNEFKVEVNCEITIEINPNAFNEQDCKNWKNAGVNRVSVGLQTSNNKILKSINRTHTKKDFHNTMQSLKKAGFTNISADLIIGLPGQKLKDIKQSLKFVLKQKVNHISAYSLILEDDSVLNMLVKKGKLTLPSEEDNIKYYTYTNKYLNKKKYGRYEVSNFSKEGYYCKHNVNCWDMYEYVGFGAGAHSFFNNTRWSNELLIHKYIELINTNKESFQNNTNDKTVLDDLINQKNLAKEYVENINKDELLEETILLGLRMAKGVNLLYIEKIFGVNLLIDKKEVIDNYIKLNMLIIENNYLKLTKSGFYVLNKIILDLVY